MSDYLPRIHALEDARATIWARNATQPDDAECLADLADQLAYLWRLRRAELAGASVLDIPRREQPIGYEAVGVKRRWP